MTGMFLLYLRICFLADGIEEVCLPEQFHCTKSDICIPSAWKCDGDIDCGGEDDSDEKDCSE